MRKTDPLSLTDHEVATSQAIHATKAVLATMKPSNQAAQEEIKRKMKDCQDARLSWIAKQTSAAVIVREWPRYLDTPDLVSNFNI